MKKVGRVYIFFFIFFFVMSLTLPLADATISVVGSNNGISISGPSVVRKQMKCEMGTSHAYTSQCQTDPPTGHSVNITFINNVTLTMSGTVSGYGAAGGAFRSAVIDGKPVADWEGAVGEQSAALDPVGVCGFKGTTPKAYTEEKTITYSVSGESTEKVGSDHEWSAAAGIYIRGIEWIGTASSSVEVGVLANLDKDPSLSVSAKASSGGTMRYQQTRDRGWSGKEGNGEWEVTKFYYCSICGGNSDRTGAMHLGGAHSHHFVCSGCNKHIKCKINPGNHKYVSCPLGPNNETCSYSSYYKCSPHIHDYSSSSSSPTDNTPNCQDCTSDCSSPCSCTTSGTCNGTVVDNTPNCSDCTSHCSSPCSCSTSGTCNGTVVDNTPNCSDCTSHCSSPCSCTNSGTCNGTVSTPPPPSPEPEPPRLVECAHGNCSEMVSSRTTHRKRCSAGHYYWPGCPNNTNWWSQDSTHELKSCRRSGCSNTWRSCQSRRNPSCSVKTNKRCSPS